MLFRADRDKCMIALELAIDSAITNILDQQICRYLRRGDPAKPDNGRLSSRERQPYRGEGSRIISITITSGRSVID